MNTDDVIDRLAREATAVQPLPAPGVRTAMWLLWALLYLVIVWMMMRMGIWTGGVRVTPLYVIQQGAALLMGITAARASFVSVIPGASRRAWTLALLMAVVWVVAIAWDIAAGARVSGTIGVVGQSDWPCVASMLLGGIVLGAPLVWMVRGGAPLTPRATAFLVGLAALSVANIEACLTRPHSFAMTVLIWHGATISGAAAACALIGRRWFRWPALVRES